MFFGVAYTVAYIERRTRGRGAARACSRHTITPSWLNLGKGEGMFKRWFEEELAREELTFEFLQAPIPKWPHRVKKIRRKVFPPWFATDDFPALFRYRGWISISLLDDRVVGYALCDYLDGDSGVYLEELAVVPAHQGDGIGTQLVLECARQARRQEFLTMWASPLAGDEHRGLWLEMRGLLPNIDGVHCSLDEIISRNDSLGFRR